MIRASKRRSSREKISRLEEYPGFAGFFFQRTSRRRSSWSGLDQVLAEARDARGRRRRSPRSQSRALRGLPSASGSPRDAAPARSGGGHRLEDLARPLREPEPSGARSPYPPLPLVRRACGSLLAVQDEAAREEGEAGRPDRPGRRARLRPLQVWERAADDEDRGDDRREGRAPACFLRLRLRRSVGAERPSRPLERAEAREADAEERTTPLRADGPSSTSPLPG